MLEAFSSPCSYVSDASREPRVVALFSSNTIVLGSRGTLVIGSEGNGSASALANVLCVIAARHGWSIQREVTLGNFTWPTSDFPTIAVVRSDDETCDGILNSLAERVPSGVYFIVVRDHLRGSLDAFGRRVVCRWAGVAKGYVVDSEVA